MTKEQLFDAARRQTDRLITRSEQLFECKVPRPEIRFDIRGQTAGMVLFPTLGAPVIRYNPGLLEAEGRSFLEKVISHEVAHLVARALHGRSIKPHGPEWKRIVRALGAIPARCHDFDTSAHRSRRVKRFRYRCGCREHLLSSIRHNRIGQGTVYRCRSCGKPLTVNKNVSGKEPQTVK